MAPIFRERYAAHGWRFFTRGLFPTLLRAVPANAVTFLVYEETLKLIK
jgi:solute carrier family 25 carnitine/acylcarnitine transporter 20/29